MARTQALRRDLAALEPQVPQVTFEVFDSEHVRVEHEGGGGYLIEFSNGYPGPCRAIGDSDFDLAGRTIAEAVSELILKFEEDEPPETDMVPGFSSAAPTTNTNNNNDDDDDDDDNSNDDNNDDDNNNNNNDDDNNNNNNSNNNISRNSRTAAETEPVVFAIATAEGEEGLVREDDQHPHHDSDDNDDEEDEYQFEDGDDIDFDPPTSGAGRSRQIDTQLLAEQEAANIAFGANSVLLAPLCDSYRVLLNVDPTAAGKISNLTAGVWGMSLTEPIVVRMLLNPSARGTSHFLQGVVAYQGASEKESSFCPEKQLRTIVHEFMRELAAAGASEGAGSNRNSNTKNNNHTSSNSCNTANTASPGGSPRRQGPPSRSRSRDRDPRPFSFSSRPPLPRHYNTFHFDNAGGNGDADGDVRHAMSALFGNIGGIGSITSSTTTGVATSRTTSIATTTTTPTAATDADILFRQQQLGFDMHPSPYLSSFPSTFHSSSSSAPIPSSSAAPVPSFFSSAPVPSSFFSSSSASRPDPAPTSPQSATDLPEQAKKWAAEKKAAFQEALREQGFFAQLLAYLQRRLPSLHKFCAICDEPHCTPPMALRSVCARTLCCWTFMQFGKLVSDAKTVSSSAEVNDLLVSLAMAAASSGRQALIFTPFPKLFLPGSAGTLALSEDMEHRWTILNEVIYHLRMYRETKKNFEGASWSANVGANINNTTGPVYLPSNRPYAQLCQPMIEWICTSIRCTIQPIPKKARLHDFRTDFQYILVSAAPEQEEEFQRLKAEYGGSTFAFHGSRTENWHSIVRNGLKVASNTALMVCGARFGVGIYLSPLADVSARYSHCNVVEEAPSTTPVIDVDAYSAEDMTGSRCVDSRCMKLLAVCEVVQDRDLRKPLPEIWVAGNAAAVVTRFLLVYNNGKVPLINLEDPGLINRLNFCMSNFSSLLSSSST